MHVAERPVKGHVVMLVRNPYTHDSRVEKEVRTLLGDGYRVTVVADAAPDAAPREQRDGATVIRVPRRASAVPGLRYLVHELRLVRILCRLRPDSLHAHDSNALVPVALAARRAGVPFIYDAHDLWLGRPRRDRSRLYFALSQLTYRFIERTFVHRAAAVITVSRPIANHLARRYGLDRVELVHNFPDLRTPERRELRGRPDATSIPENRRIVLYLGALMGGRGLENLVDAVPHVEGADLVLLGSGALEAPLVRRAREAGSADRVHLLAPVPSNEVVDYAASADVGVSPIVPSCLNYRYSLPNKLFQYMAAGVPVVASDFPQVREVVRDSGCGLVVDTSRPADIAAAVNWILSDPGRALVMGERGRAAVEERYNWSTAADVLLSVYAGLRG